MKRALIVLLAGCAASADPAPSPSPAINCEIPRRQMAGRERNLLLAKDFISQVPRVREAWAQAPEACRDGMWYAQAANALRFPEMQNAPLGAFSTSKQALEAGLRKDPRSAPLVAFVAYLSSLAPEESPPLPPNACAQLSEASDLAMRAYVCAAEAANQKRWKDALAELERAKPEKRFPDVKLRQGQAWAELGDRKKARAVATGWQIPAPARDCLPFCAPEHDVERLRTRATWLVGR